MNYVQFFRKHVPILRARYSRAGEVLSRRRLLDEVKKLMTKTQWDAVKSKIDQTEAGLPHHLNANYDPAKAKKLIAAWKKARYVTMYGPMRCLHCGATEGRLFKVSDRNLLYPNDYCSESCSKASDRAKAKREATTLTLYGTKNVAQSQHFRDSMAKAAAEGVYMVAASKGQATRAKIHGSVEASYRKQFKKTARTNRERYGSAGPMSDPKVQAKNIESVKKRFGVRNVSQSPEVQKKIKEGWKTTKTVRIQGKTFTGLQGYEPQVLKWMCDQGVRAKQVSTNVPAVKYTFEGKDRMYFPDFVSSSGKTVVEVKSVYTSGIRGKTTDGYGNYAMNRAKIKAANKQGYLTRFVIYNEGVDDCFVWEGPLPKRVELLAKYEAWLEAL